MVESVGRIAILRYCQISTRQDESRLLVYALERYLDFLLARSATMQGL
jgi:hypothetical protein